MESALALVHSRFSTNTFPSWNRAHPYRYLAHNGEINTLRGNINWMHARQAMFESELFGEDIRKILPVINTDGSDSAMFDNCLELLVLGGRSLPHAVMMMIPEPWENHESMSAERRAFYEYHSCLMEPWDGPASIAFTDGVRIGAVLDRNGLRPSRYYVTKDDLVIMASEAGVLPVEPERVAIKGRLQPGRMFLVDTEEGRIVADEELKTKYARAHPYQEWLDKNHVLLDSLPEPPHVHEHDHRPGFKAITLPIVFNADEGAKGLESALEELFAAADRAIANSVNVLLLSDRGLDARLAPIPAMLAVGGLHHHLIRQGTRTRV